MTTSVSLTREQRIAYLQQLQAQKKAQMTSSASVQDSVFANDIAKNSCTDGIDDGKIDIFSKIGNVVEGVGKSVVNMVTSAIQPKNLLKTAATIGICCIPVVGPIVGAGLACCGIYQGGKQVMNAIELAESATTDAEAKAAWENIGGGTFTVGLSVAGLKGSASALKGQLNGGSTTVNAYRNGETSATQILENAVKETGQNALKICETAVEKAKKAHDKFQDVKNNGIKKTVSDTTHKASEWVQDKFTDKNHVKRDAKAVRKASDNAAQSEYDAKVKKLQKKYGLDKDGADVSKLTDAKKTKYNEEMTKLDSDLKQAKADARAKYNESVNPRKLKQKQKAAAKEEATKRVQEFETALGEGANCSEGGKIIKRTENGYEVTSGNETIVYDKNGVKQYGVKDANGCKTTEYSDGRIQTETSTTIQDIKANGDYQRVETQADGTKITETMKSKKTISGKEKTVETLEKGDGSKTVITTEKGKTLFGTERTKTTIKTDDITLVDETSMATGRNGATYETQTNVRYNADGISRTSTKTTNLGNGQKITIKRVGGETTYMMDGRNVTSSIEKLQCELGASKFVNEPITIPGTNITLDPNQGTALISALNALKNE